MYLISVFLFKYQIALIMGMKKNTWLFFSIILFYFINIIICIKNKLKSVSPFGQKYFFCFNNALHFLYCFPVC